MKVYASDRTQDLLAWDTPRTDEPWEATPPSVCAPLGYYNDAQYKLDWDTEPPRKYKDCGVINRGELRLYEDGGVFVPPALWATPDGREYFKEVTKGTAVVVLHSELPQTALPDGTPVTKKYLQGFYKRHSMSPRHPSTALRTNHVVVDKQYNYILPLSSGGFYIPKQGYRPCPRNSSVWWEYLPVTRESLLAVKKLLAPLQETGEAMVMMQGYREMPRSFNDHNLPWVKGQEPNVFDDPRYNQDRSSASLATRVCAALAEDIVEGNTADWSAAHYMAVAIMSQNMTWGNEDVHQQLFAKILERMHPRIRAPFLRLR